MLKALQRYSITALQHYNTAYCALVRRMVTERGSKV